MIAPGAARAALILALPLLSALCSTQATAEARRPAQEIGAEVGYFSVPLGISDPYSFAASAGLWYDRALGASPLRLGPWASAAGFRSLDSSYGPSFMYYGGLQLDYSLELLRSQDSEISILPLARFGWYARSIEAAGTTVWGSRPFAAAGILVDLRLGSMVTGLALLLSLPFDNSPVYLLGATQRLGLCF